MHVPVLQVNHIEGDVFAIFADPNKEQHEMGVIFAMALYKYAVERNKMTPNFNREQIEAKVIVEMEDFLLKLAENTSNKN